MRTGWLSLVGLILVLPLLVGTLQGSVTLQATAVRVVVLVAGLAVADRAVLPAFRLFLALLSPSRPASGSTDGDQILSAGRSGDAGAEAAT